MDGVFIEPNSKAPVPIVIPVSNTISEAFDTEGANLTGLLIPDSWTGGATITFQAAEKHDAAVYKPLVGATGTAVQVTGVVAGRVVSVSAVTELRGLRYFKIVAASAVTAKTTVMGLRAQGGVGQ